MNDCSRWCGTMRGDEHALSHSHASARYCWQWSLARVAHSASGTAAHTAGAQGLSGTNGVWLISGRGPETLVRANRSLWIMIVAASKRQVFTTSAGRRRPRGILLASTAVGVS